MLATLVSMMIAAPVPAATPIRCDGLAIQGIVRMPLGKGFKRFHARAKVEIAPKGSPTLAFEFSGPGTGAILAVAVLAPSRLDGSVPPIWSTMIGASAGNVRGRGFVVMSEFDIDLWQDPDGIAHLKLAGRGDDGRVQQDESVLLAPRFEQGGFNLSCSNARFELSDVTME